MNGLDRGDLIRSIFGGKVRHTAGPREGPFLRRVLVHAQPLEIRLCNASPIDRVRGPPLSLCFSFPFFVQAMPVAAIPLQRKKSLPDVAQPIQLTATSPLSREEVSVLSSMRREEIRRQIDESERLRANPLLYLVSPQVKDWFSRQQLVMLVLFINISLALMFFKLLT